MDPFISGFKKANDKYDVIFFEFVPPEDSNRHSYTGKGSHYNYI